MYNDAEQFSYAQHAPAGPLPKPQALQQDKHRELSQNAQMLIHKISTSSH